MDSDKDLIKRAVGNRADMSMSSTAQKRTIDWVDPHSAASTPRKLQSPRGGRSDSEKDTSILQKEEAVRVAIEQARDMEGAKEGTEGGVTASDQHNHVKHDETTEKPTEKGVGDKADDKTDKNDDKTDSKPAPDTTNGHTKESSKTEPGKTEVTKTESGKAETSKPDHSLPTSTAESASSRTHSRSNSTTTSRPSSVRGSSTPARSPSQAPSLPLPTYNTWKYSAKTITKASPSAKEGMSFREELMMRTKGINFLGNVAKLLQLPHMAVYTACTFFHRFYMRHSIKSKHPFEAAAVCIFLATKVEESNRHLRDVCICLVKVAQKDHRAVVDEQSKDFWRWRDCILYGEGFFLEVLCFDLTLDSPFEHLSYYVKKLGINHVREVCKTAWEFVTDSCKTPLCLMFSTNTIALAAIYWAAKNNKTPIDYQKETKAKGKQHWVECFDMTRNEVVYVVETFCDWYSVLQRDFGLATSYPKLK